jgi:hypothetical protein
VDVGAHASAIDARGMRGGSYIPSIAPWRFTSSKRDVTDARAFPSLRQKTQIAAVPGLIIDWDEMLLNIS